MWEAVDKEWMGCLRIEPAEKLLQIPSGVVQVLFVIDFLSSVEILCCYFKCLQVVEIFFSYSIFIKFYLFLGILLFSFLACCYLESLTLLRTRSVCNVLSCEVVSTLLGCSV